MSGNFKGWWDAGYRDLLPVVPPDANVSPKSHVANGKGKSPGIKHPSGLWGGFQGWNTHQATEQDIEDWQHMGASVGLRFGEAWLLDLDIYDEATADMVEQHAIEMLGPAPMRVGQWPKRALLYRNDGSITPRKLRFAGKQGEVNLIEIPPQAVVQGVHAKTGRPYEWRRPPGKFENLTVVSADALAAFLKKMKALLPSAGNVEGASETTVKQETLKGDPDVVAAAMAKMPNKRDMRWDYMVRMGYALKAALPDHPDLAYTLWDDWCERWEDDGYDPGAQETRWASMKGPYRAGASWIYEEAEKAGAFDRAEAWFAPIISDENPFTEIELNALKAGAEEADGVYPVVDVNALMTREPPKMLVARHIPEQSIGFVYGEPGSFKSFLTLDIGLHIAAGQPEWHGDRLDVDPESIVVYLAFEGAFGMRNRIRAWCKQHEVEPADLAKRFKMIEVSVNFMEPKDIAKLIRTVRQAIGARPCLIVADTVSRALPGADENLQKDMTLFVHACDALRQAFGCAVVGVHHAGKSGDMRGSTVLRGAGDYVFRMTRREKSSLVALECEKQKDAPDGWSDTYATASIELEGGESSLALERMEAGLGVGPDVELTPAVTTKVLEAMEAAWVSGEPWTATYHGRDRHAVQQMCRGFGFNAVDAEAALRGWIASGIVAEDLVDRKKKRKGLKVVGRVQAAETAVWNSDIYG